MGTDPVPLPGEIRLSNGFTRTGPDTYTPEEIADAGWTGPYTKPEFNMDEFSIRWDSENLEYVLDPIEPFDEMTHNREWDFDQQKYIITPKSEEEILKDLRVIRQQILIEHDWTQLPDAPLTEIEVQAYRNFREELRSMFDNYTGYDSVVWPSYTEHLEALQSNL